MDNSKFILAGAILIAALLYMQSSRYNRTLPLQDKVSTEYDFVIVGGGTAGSVLASRLAETGEFTVLILEAGGSYEDEPRASIPLLWTMLLNSSSTWNYYTTPQEHSNQGCREKQAYWTGGRVLGGSSTVNGMIYSRGNPSDYDQWAEQGCSNWAYKDVLPYFLKSEDIQVPTLLSSEFHKTGGPLPVSSGRKTSLTDYYLKAGKELGYDLTDYNSGTPEGFSEIQLTVQNGKRVNMAEAYLRTGTEKQKLDISTESLVTKIDIQNGKATGVYFIKRGKKQYVKSRREVIVSAGAVNSPQLLMLSGIGPDDHLREMNVPVNANLPVGNNLQNHPMVIMSTSIRKELGINLDLIESWQTMLKYKLLGTGPLSGTAAEAVAFLKDPNSPTLPPQITLNFISTVTAFNAFNFNDNLAKEILSESPKLHGFSTLIGIPHPKSRGILKLKSTDPFDDPLIDSQQFADKDDIKNIISGIRIWERLMETKVMEELDVNIDELRTTACDQHEYRSDGYWECFVRHFGSTYFHPAGTCRMGPVTDSRSVVDPELKVLGIRGLRVVDASVFPTITSGFTYAPVIMLAEKAADLILKRDSVADIRGKYLTHFPK